MLGVELPDTPDVHEYSFGGQCCIHIKSRMYTVYEGETERLPKFFKSKIHDRNVAITSGNVRVCFL
jgi:hypothetical protein